MMSSECIAFLNMISSWVGVIVTFLAVVVALWLPRKASKDIKKESRSNTCKIIQAQLNLAKNRLDHHKLSINQAIINVGFINLSMPTETMISSLNIKELEFIYKFIQDIELTEQARRKACSLLGERSNSEFIPNKAAYKSGVESLLKSVKSGLELFVT
ncbi:MAG TPA: hypothetical protein ENH67_09190 [Pseudoalteromonas sp.]|nr:hypothetical protein [Pseudoalteromonas sp.]HDY92893.1 hypothetical protein [Pseudoalteromonas sp.]HDZ33045.1 hypothetical protein [Pseudoalteromonas sp.]